MENHYLSNLCVWTNTISLITKTDFRKSFIVCIIIKWLYDTYFEIAVGYPQRVLAFVTHHAKRDLMEIAKSFNHGHPAQSAQSAQADLGRNFSLLADFLYIKWQFYLTKLSLWNYQMVSACACFVPVFISLSRSSSKVPFRVMSHNYS